MLNRRSRVHAARQTTSDSKFSWSVLLHEMAAGLIAAALVAGVSIAWQAKLDDDRSKREQRTENLRFVRERSTFEDVLLDRPFNGMDLEEQNLSGLRLHRADFREANLYKGVLRSTELNGALLDKADLREADMELVNLQEAALGGANLAGANLKSAFLKEASLFEADLTNANLSDAILTGATLARARLDGANLNGAKLEDIDYGDKGTYGTEEVYTVCYDEATIWPDGYQLPNMDADYCSKSTE
jgi:hypothetical protein